MAQFLSVALAQFPTVATNGSLVKLQDAAYALIPFLPQFMGIDTQKLHGDVMDRIGVLEAEGLVDWKAIPGLPSVQIDSHGY